MQKRLFAAIKIDPGQTLNYIQKKLITICQHDKIKWVQLNNIHITLYFFGNTDESLVDTITYQLKEATNNILPFDIDISNIGIFGSSYNPKVIWLGINECFSLKMLSDSILNHLSKIKFYSDRQNFIPHITLGRIQRINDKKSFQKQLNDIKSSFIQKTYVNKIFLFESILTKEGAVYNIIETFHFKEN